MIFFDYINFFNSEITGILVSRLKKYIYPLGKRDQGYKELEVSTGSEATAFEVAT